MAKFKTRQGAIIDDIKTYVANWIAERPNAKIFIGCDSQEHDRNIDYAVSICIYDPGKGGHVIDKRTTHPLTKTNQHRLWEELNKSLEVAEELKILGCKITIHVDYNSNPKEMSNELYDAGIGYAASMGYEAEGKPFAFAATYCADKAVR